MRPARKSRERGLFKRCPPDTRHLWDRCSCPWLGRYRHVRWVNLAAWAAAGRGLTRSEAIRVLGDVRSAIDHGEFDPAGKRVKVDPSTLTFGQFLDSYTRDEVEKRKLKDKALPGFLKATRERFGSSPLALVARSPRDVEAWLESLSASWGPRTWNAYRTLGVRLFNWGRHPRQALVTENPFLHVPKRKGEVRRETRITLEQQQRLLAVCDQWMTATRKGSDTPNKSLQRLGREMHLRLLAAFETGLRAGEMLQIQIKHIDFTNWKITLPWDVSKGGKTTGKAEAVWVMNAELRKALEQRRFLSADAYVFGTDDGQRVLKFHKAWRRLFKEAGLPAHLIWHDARHEFVSSLIEEGGNIQEVREAARHKSITTTARYMAAYKDRVKALLEKRAQRLQRNV